MQINHPHKADDLQNVPILQNGLSVPGPGDDVPVALHRQAGGVPSGLGQILGHGLPGQVGCGSIDLYHSGSLLNIKRRRGS